MANIPEKHKKYNILPFTKDMDFDAIEYPWSWELRKLLPKGKHLVPYGYASVEEYIRYVEEMSRQYAKTKGQRKAFRQFIEDTRRLNQKEYWSVLRYVGEEWDEPLRFTPGQAYYWPCDPDDPEFLGIIDDQEFTGYLYAPDPQDWEILEDPTGMAYETMYGKDRDKWKWTYEDEEDKEIV